MNENEYIVNLFTKKGENVNLEVDNLNVSCITSKNNNFELDKDGNLKVKSLTVSDSIEVYPIGSIYMSINNTNPGLVFGGTWERIQDTFLLAAGNIYQNGTTGGEASHTLSGEEMPYHYHSVNLNTSEAGVHSHGVWATYIGSSHHHYYDPGDALSNGSNGGTKYHNPHSIHIAGNHVHSVNGITAGVGGGRAHNNMPPYLVVYMWKRVA